MKWRKMRKEKKWLYVVRVLVLFIAVIGNGKLTEAETIADEDRWRYEIVDNEVRITGYNTTVSEGSEERFLPDNIIIPDNIDGLPVTIIGSNAFQSLVSCRGSLKLPAKLRVIEDNIWGDSNRLANLRKTRNLTGELFLPDTLENIGKYAFICCGNLTGDFNLPTGIQTIGDYAFYNCSGLTGKLNIPNKITEISMHAFSGCLGLTGELNIPDKVVSIGDYAFYNCSGLAGELNIPDGVIMIGNGAFRNCSGLTGKLNIPDRVTSIGSYAFSNCSGFTGNLDLPSGLTSIEIGTFSNCIGLTGDLLFPEGISVIEQRAFRGCTGFNGKLVFPSTLVRIGGERKPTDEDYDEYEEDGAFYGCSNITGSIHIPENVKILGPGTFYGCSKLQGDISLPKGIKEIQECTFYGCTGLSGDLIIPENVIQIEWRAFYGCSGFQGNLKLPDTLIRISKEAFRGCSGLTGDLLIPSSVTEIGAEGFYGCRNLNGKLTLSNQLQTISEKAFYGCTGIYGTLMIPNSVKIIENSAFYQCSGLTGELVLPEQIKEIKEKAFYGCNFSGNLIIPASVTAIEPNAFYCKNINRIDNQTAISLPLSEFGGEDSRLWYDKKQKSVLKHSEGYVQNSVVIETISKLSLNQGAMSMLEGTETSLEARYSPSVLSDEIDQTIQWTSDNEEIVLIQNGNTINAVKEGSATVTARASSGVTASCTITVTKKSSGSEGGSTEQLTIPIQEVKLSQTELKLEKGTSGNLKAEVLPANTTMSKQISWKSSNTAVATVDNQGNVYATGGGYANIIASGVNGISGYCTVIVNEKMSAGNNKDNITVPSTSNNNQTGSTNTVPTDNKGQTENNSVTSSYQIQYVLNGGTNNKANPSSYNGKVALKAPKRKGYLFVGWYVSSKFTGKVTTIQNKNITVYAKWSKVTVGRVSKVSLKNQKGRKLKVSYPAVKKANGYQIVYSTNKKFVGKTTKSVNLSSRSRMIQKLSKKTYYIRVRAYRYDSLKKKVYGKWSSTKKIKIKK